MFEADLHWERTENVSSVPGFISKLMEYSSLHNPNSSLNLSSSSLLSDSFTNPRRGKYLEHITEVTDAVDFYVNT